jgi:anti-sigma factor RsiW
MNEDLHVRAQRLLLQSAVEGLNASEESWLREHLAGCADCAHEMAAARELVHALRVVPVSVPRDLAARAQLRVRLRAQETSAAASGSFWLWVVTAASWLLGVFSAPLVWKVFAWTGSNFGVPKLALEFGFVLWWTVPALIAVGVVLHQRAFSAHTERH